jgi:hypothetical protein
MSATDNARNPRFQRSMYLTALALYPIWVVIAVTMRSNSGRREITGPPGAMACGAMMNGIKTAMETYKGR